MWFSQLIVPLHSLFLIEKKCSTKLSRLKRMFSYICRVRNNINFQLRSRNSVKARIGFGMYNTEILNFHHTRL